MSLVSHKEDNHTINMEEVQSLSCEGLEPQTIDSISKTTQPKEYNQEILAVEIVKNEKIFLLSKRKKKYDLNFNLNRNRLFLTLMKH